MELGMVYFVAFVSIFQVINSYECKRLAKLKNFGSTINKVTGRRARDHRVFVAFTRRTVKTLVTNVALFEAEEERGAPRQSSVNAATN